MYDGNYTANERYRTALIGYGDQLILNGDYCGGRDQYQLALSISLDGGLAPTATQAQLLCSPPTSTPAPVTATTEFTPTPDGGGIWWYRKWWRNHQLRRILLQVHKNE